MAQESPVGQTAACCSPSTAFQTLRIGEADASPVPAAAGGGPAASEAPALLAGPSSRGQSAAPEIKISQLDVLVRLFNTACRHGGGTSEYGNRTGDGSLCELDYRELYDCVDDCWARVHPGPWVRPVHSHECNSNCPMIIHRDTYVCAVSNSVHHCTQYTCEYAMEFEHERVCPITANAYPSHFKFSFEQIGHLDEQRKRDICVTSTTNAKPKRDHLSLHHPPTAAPADADVDAPLSMAALRRAASAAAVPEEDMHLRVESFVGRFLRRPLHADIRKSTAARLLELWRLIQALPGLTLPSNYSLQAHVFTIMWASSKNALTMGPYTFYPFDPSLVDCMRDLSECIVGELRCPFNAHTKFTSAVNTAMRIWYMQRVKALPCISFAPPLPPPPNKKQAR